MLSNTEENYIRGIYKLSGIKKAIVSTNAISEHIKTTAASVTDMLKKLAEKKLINYEKYKGVRLSKKGEKAAIALVRKHRLWEVFLVDKLGFAWDEVHEIAEQLEHIKSVQMIQKLDAFLGYPKFDPHGDPIPDKNGKFEYASQKSLSDLKIGETAVIVGVKDSSSKFLKYLSGVNIALGSKVTAIEKEDYDESLIIKINNRKKITVSSLVSKNLYVN